MSTHAYLSVYPPIFGVINTRHVIVPLLCFGGINTQRVIVPLLCFGGINTQHVIVPLLRKKLKTERKQQLSHSTGTCTKTAKKIVNEAETRLNKAFTLETRFLMRVPK